MMHFLDCPKKPQGRVQCSIVLDECFTSLNYSRAENRAGSNDIPTFGLT